MAIRSDQGIIETSDEHKPKIIAQKYQSSVKSYTSQQEAFSGSC